MNKNSRSGASSAVIISILVVVLIIAGAIYYVTTKENPEESGPETNSPVNLIDFEATPTDGGESGNNDGGITITQIFTVTYTNEGYSPRNLAIKAGAAVEFENNSSNQVWTASDVHPTHEILPEFDALRGYEPGETYSYTFKEPGAWTYHNHLNPSQIGTIIVTE